MVDEARYVEAACTALRRVVKGADNAAIQEAAEDLAFAAAHTDDGKLRGVAYRTLQRFAGHAVAGPAVQAQVHWVERTIAASDA
ncbi:hypothetical protein [Reyranella sp.]|uniref:hypothetical protein n=1 Tax=Reyranella sp. TaxID=1929291 RepID=UPI003C7C3DF3